MFIKRIISKIKNVRSDISQIKDYEKITSKNVDNIFAYNQLARMFGLPVFLPLTKWSLSPQQVLHICNDIYINERKTIIEFGLGFSSLCIAQLIKANNLKTKYYCVENNPEWIKKIKQTMISLELEEYISILEVPITDVPTDIAYKNQETWYDIQILSQQLIDVFAVDLVVVDGPFASNLPFARYSAIPYLQNRLAEDYAVFLDDTNRAPEREIVNVWQKTLNCKISNYTEYSVLTSHNRFEILPY